MSGVIGLSASHPMCDTCWTWCRLPINIVCVEFVLSIGLDFVLFVRIELFLMIRLSGVHDMLTPNGGAFIGIMELFANAVT